MKLSRKEVFELIDNERNYQLEKWNNEKQDYSISEWLTIMRKYITDAENSVFENENEKALFSILKITSLGVASLEEMGCKPRNLET